MYNINMSMENSGYYNGFEPVYDEKSELLILGSFPSVISRQNEFYYGNKRNSFWSIMSEFFEEKIKEASFTSISNLSPTLPM